MIKQKVEFDEMEVPPILYKYRDWSNPWHKTILTKSEVYLAPPNSFEDEFDCKIPLRYDLITDEQLYKKYLEDSYEKNLHFTRQLHRQYARHEKKKSSVRDPHYLKQHDNHFSEIFNKYFGVLSLTANSKKLEMWEIYSLNHTGFCVGFDSKQLLQKFGGWGEVTYRDEFPVIHPFDDYMKKAIKNIYSKLQKWSFEEEYRTHRFDLDATNDDWRKVIIDTNAFKEIIIGAKTEEREREEIISLCKDKYPEAKILQSILQNGVLTFNEI